MKLNRTVVAATAALLMIALPTASQAAAKKKPAPKPVKHVRTVTFTYDNPCAVTLQSSAIFGPGGSFCTSASQISTSRTEKYMSVTITDKTGQSVPVTFVEDGSSAAWDIICGKATDLSVAPNDTYDLNPAVAIGDKCPVAATTGTVTVKLSNLP
jgi:hypothetical protein